MWSTHYAPVQLSLFAEDYARSRTDAEFIIAKAVGLRADTFARALRVLAAKVRAAATDVLTARIEPTELGYHNVNRQARQMQAEVTADLIRQAVTKTVSILRSTVFAPLATLVRRHSLAIELNRLDDRLLADIGMHRGAIPGIARDAFPVPSSRVASEVSRFVETRVLAPVTVWLQRRSLATQLNALDDRLLADIGLLRADIAKLVREAFPLKPAMTVAPETTTVHAFPITDTSVPLATPANESERPLAA